MDRKNIPKKALNCYIPISQENIFKEDEDKEKKYSSFKMVGNTGKVIEKHWYWGNLVFDLNGVILKDKTPILWAHDSDLPMGFSTGPEVTDEGLVFTEKDTVFLDNNDEVDKFIDYSKQGMPFQASVGMNPKKIEFVDEGASATVNNMSVDGPINIIREWDLRECSVCLFGADNKTSASAFKDGDESVDLSNIFIETKKDNPNKGKTMNVKEFKEQYPDSASLFKQEVIDELSAEYFAKEEQFKADVEKANVKAEEWKTKFEEVSNKVREFEAEKIKDEAATIWKTKFEEAGLPERLFAKVSKQVSADAFMAEGAFNKDEFSAAIDAELKDWEEFADKPAQIQGTAQTKTADVDIKKEVNFFDIDAQLDRLNPGMLKKAE